MVIRSALWTSRSTRQSGRRRADSDRRERALAAGSSTKFVLPMESTALLRPLLDHVERSGEAKSLPTHLAP